MSAMIAALIMCVVGYFVLSEIHVAAVMCGLLLVSEAIQAGFKWFRKGSGEARPQWLTVAGVAAILLVTLAAARMDQKAAYERAEMIVGAVERYEADKKTMPENLSDLVPHYLAGVPRAKYTLLWGVFRYEEGRLYWAATPMLAVPEYDFKSKKWGYRRTV